jgi:hypothetical protein
MPRPQPNTDLFGFFIADLADAIAARLQRAAPSGARKAGASLRGPKRKKGQKRTPDSLAELTSALLGHIKSNPGQRIEQIAAALKIPTSELKLPAQKLIAGKAVKTKGQRRGTHYFAA